MAAQAAPRRTEPTLAAQSLDQLTATARHAQQDLDVLLSVLDDGITTGSHTLEALDTLTRGLDVHASVGHLDKIPAPDLARGLRHRTGGAHQRPASRARPGHA
ncbi:hypothetical protein [Nonomuraea rubra]|nr:hypothetical protein [Nonomuraea rubra]